MCGVFVLVRSHGSVSLTDEVWLIVLGFRTHTLKEEGVRGEGGTVVVQ